MGGPRSGCGLPRTGRREACETRAELVDVGALVDRDFPFGVPEVELALVHGVGLAAGRRADGAEDSEEVVGRRSAQVAGAVTVRDGCGGAERVTCHVGCDAGALRPWCRAREGCGEVR